MLFIQTLNIISFYFHLWCKVIYVHNQIWWICCDFLKLCGYGTSKHMYVVHIQIMHEVHLVHKSSLKYAHTDYSWGPSCSQKFTKVCTYRSCMRSMKSTKSSLCLRYAWGQVDEKTQVSFQKKKELVAMRNTVIAPVKGWNHSKKP
jgi:hypothetical protein